jgi:hypothetical protein
VEVKVVFLINLPISKTGGEHEEEEDMYLQQGSELIEN